MAGQLDCEPFRSPQNCHRPAVPFPLVQRALARDDQEGAFARRAGQKLDLRRKLSAAPLDPVDPSIESRGQRPRAEIGRVPAEQRA